MESAVSQCTHFGARSQNQSPRQFLKAVDIVCFRAFTGQADDCGGHSGLFVSEVAYFRNGSREKPFADAVGLGPGLRNHEGSAAPASASLDDALLAQFRQSFAEGCAADPKHFGQCGFGG